MAELFEAKMKWSDTKVGDSIETKEGKVLKIISIHGIHWYGDRKIIIRGTGVPVLMTEEPEKPKQLYSYDEYLTEAIEEIDYAIKTEKTKSAEVRRHYLENAVRYINEAKEAKERNNVATVSTDDSTFTGEQLKELDERMMKMTLKMESPEVTEAYYRAKEKRDKNRRD